MVLPVLPLVVEVDSTAPVAPRLGVDARKLPGATALRPHEILDRIDQLGFDGALFRSVFDLSPTLDHGALAEIRAHADDLGLYLESGLGKVNPFATPESPQLRAAGDGDILLGFRRMMQACAAIDCRELWAATANYQLGYGNRFTWDRFRTDAPWAEQLEATYRFLLSLRPIALDLGQHINLETHEEITSFELVELIGRVGPDVCGIVFDTANLLQRLEHPARTTERVAPYVRQTQLKDATIVVEPSGNYRYDLRPCGDGLVDFDHVVTTLREYAPTVNLTIENVESRDDFPGPSPVTVLPLDDPEFLAGHPDLSLAEFADYVALVNRRGDRTTDSTAPHHDDALAALTRSRDHLRPLLVAGGVAC